MVKVQTKQEILNNKTLLLDAYEKMLLIRRFEEKAGQLYGMGQIGGFCHLYIGQEAVAVGVQLALEEKDSVITSYRDHGQMLAIGSDPKVVMAELLGKQTGCSKGKGGSMHMFDLERRFYGGHGIVAAQVPIGTGIAFAYKYRKQNNVCVTYFGDGAVNQGQVYESFNMAKLWNLPVLYIVENNKYAMGTSVERSSGEVELYKRGISFGIEGKKIDGMNFESVYHGIKEAVDQIKSGRGPLLIEVETYRYRGHSMSDPAKYRAKEEVEKYKSERDPIDAIEKHLISSKLATKPDLEAIEKRIVDQVKEAVAFAQNSSEPSEEELYKDIYVV
ncbi:MAG: pyruvate dehydrogenase (acetyl-transferring) E1 component subunit alpha [Candidatus Jidaibacter sp.]|jgi:pyruvate dehydrogenase E1 component alpha subunit|nr:pyruvate dehydrogenase (acetyl-transferring) E1 component subunit alpha [Candidatus Jidaibacter sp.]